MLSEFKNLSVSVDGRYANDSELQFIEDYMYSYKLRLDTYKKLQSLEPKIVDEVRSRLELFDSKLLKRGDRDMAVKWKQDTVRVLRYSATALLLDDTELLQERFLFWFQTIMRAFGTQRSCDATYTVMQEVIKQYLSPAEIDLITPILELNRSALGLAS